MLKKILLTLLVVVGLLALVSLFLPSKIQVSRSVQIDVPPAIVFKEVNHLKSWKNWSHWDQLDPEMKSTFEGPESGAGAVHSWTSNHRSVGTGSLTIVESVEPDSVLIALNFGPSTSTGGWTFEAKDGGTLATTYMNLDLGFMGRIFPGLMMKKWLGEDFDKSLANLKAYCEGLPMEPPAVQWTVETITTTATPVMSMKVIANQTNFSTKLGESYGKIMEVIAKQGLRQAGPMYAIYYQWSADTVSMEPGIQVDKSGKSEGDVMSATLPSVKAIKVDYYGDYPGTEKAHYFMDDWAKANGVVIIGAPWEEYVTDSNTEPDTSKWLTRIYYPVE